MSTTFRDLHAALVAAAIAMPAAAAPVQRDHLTAELVATRTDAATVKAALVLVHEPKWHTYWTNPGDSGLATAIDWSLPDGVTAGPIEWPTPHRLPVGPLVNIGYDGELWLPVTLTLAPSARGASALPASAKASWLVCEEICIPGDATFTLDLAQLADDAALAPQLARAEALRPVRDARWKAELDVGGDDAVVTLSVPTAGADSASEARRTAPTATELETLELFPAETQVLANPRGRTEVLGAGLVRVVTPKSDYFVAAPATLTLVAAFGAGDTRRSVEIVATPAGGVPASVGANAVDASAGDASAAPANAASRPNASDVAHTDTDTPTLAWALGLAFLGGLLLNLMPCVFPVLALKALSLADGAHDRAAARRDGGAYLAGVLSAFGALAGGLIALRATGEALGWGFQLQLPWVVAALALLMLAVGLNLSGLYALGGRFMGSGQALTEKRGASGAYFTGLLAVVVASPCTAPFMGPALGYAATQSAPVAIAVFLALGLGLALPLVLLALMPALARVMPRPGAWMDTLKQALAFPMYATAVWLAWVLGRQVGTDGMAIVLLGGVALGFALWVYGRPLRARSGARRALRAAAMLMGLAGAFAAIAAITARRGDAPGAIRIAAGDRHDAGAGERKEPWSPDRLATLRAEHRAVFVNMTAAWCITCLANERAALATDEVARAMDRLDVAYLEGDWTNRDAAITQYLAQFDRNGVPLYVVYPADGSAPAVLPQVLTPGLVVAALEAAARAR